MIVKILKASRCFSLVTPTTALLRLVPIFLLLVGVAQAQRLNHDYKSQSDKVSLQLQGNRPAGDSVTVIVSLNESSSGSLNGFLQRNRVRLRREMRALRSFSVSLPFGMVAELAAFPEVDRVSANAPVVSFGHPAITTGAVAGQAATIAAGRGLIDGTGVVIAILDSGIDVNHAQFALTGGSSRILANVDFTGENRTDDPYGHGTFVAAAAAGGAGAGPEYTGIAPGASLLNVRVLDSEGQGTVENVLAGLNWVATNARQYNIRIVNLSLGTRAVESYKYDVLCRAVRGLVNSGILVFVAAGNEGKDSLDHKIYGSIHSPGIEPSAFTIGASNSFQTDARSDDRVATFSSRGPTRGRWVDADGVTHYDNLIKPDLVAPGNKLVFAQAPNNLLVTQNPTLNESSSGIGPTMRIMTMSGTSVSSPIASGAAALLLQLNSKLTPNMVKAFMEYTAQQLSNSGPLDQGSGQLNIEGAMRLVLAVRTDLASPVQVGLSLLTDSVTPSSSFSGSSFNWSTAIIRKFNTVSGSGLISRFHEPYATGQLLGDGFLLSDGLIISKGTLYAGAQQLSDGNVLWTSNGFVADGVMVSDDVLMSDAVDISNQNITVVGSVLSDALLKGGRSVTTPELYDGILFTSGILLSTGHSFGNGTLINNPQFLGDGILGGSGTLSAGNVTISDSITMANGIINGDGTIYSDGTIVDLYVPLEQVINDGRALDDVALEVISDYAAAVGSGVQLTRSEQNHQYDFQVMKYLPTA